MIVVTEKLVLRLREDTSVGFIDMSRVHVMKMYNKDNNSNKNQVLIPKFFGHLKLWSG